MKNCIICQNELSKTQVKYCSNKCKQKGHYQKYKTNANSTYSQYKRADIRKKEFIKLKGGGCSICGYNKNTSALEFHHINQEHKDFHFSNTKTTNINKIRKELNKCILICANCHREIHYPQNNKTI